MRNKKKAKTKKTPEQEALERSVDAIMDPKKPDETAAETVSVPVAAPAPLAIETGDTDTKTAPQLSAKLRKQITVAGVPTAPLSIDKLDELAASIAEADTKPEPAAAEAEETTDESDSTEQPAPSNDATEQSTELDDPQTDKAVDNIVAYESDVMLAIADSTVAERKRQAEASSPKRKRHPFATFLWTLIFVLAILAIIATVLLVSGGNLPGLRNQ